jgi:hypothetical protein
MFKKYSQYLKDNPEGYWFKRKLYGWGWVPVKWQGWLIVGIYIVAVILFGSTISENSLPNEIIFTFFLPVTLLTITLIRICYWKGEKPRWQWGLPKEDKHNNEIVGQ